MKRSNNIIQDWLDKYGDPKIDKKMAMELEEMNKERYNQIIDEVYGNYISYIHDIVQGEHQIYGNWYGKKEFINKCKSDNEFSERWGLKIEERELSLDERIDYALSKDDFRFTDAIINEEDYEKFGIPTKQITLEYNGTKIEIYE
jgi:hypothetical protein